MDRARSRSRSPRRDRSTERGNRPRERKQGGFRWKDKNSRRDRDDNGQDDNGRDDRRGLQRGYRNRSRSRSRDARQRNGSRSPRRDRVRDTEPRDRDWGRGRDRNEDRGPDRDRDRGRESDRGGDRGKEKDKGKGKDKGPPKPEKKKTTAKPAKSGEELIVVYVNDRLGTKTAIPCLPSDPIGLFKIMVASRVGRKPHELLLKRQGERPFKDQLTLQDYGVSNGVQLDLEVDTGD